MTNAIRISVALLALLVATPAFAQTSTTGAIQGVVVDKASGEGIAGVTIVASSPVLQGTQSAITDERGQYKISNLPPGTYQVELYYGDIVVRRVGLVVSLNATTPGHVRMNTADVGGEVVVIEGLAPQLDPTSTTQGMTVDEDYLRNIPNPGRTFEGALGAAPGAGQQELGPTFSGSSALENQYIVDGVNTTELVAGSIGTSVVNEFIEEIQILTGGYNAEYGRSTGGVVNVVTKTGSNTLHGSAFAYASSGALTAAAKSTPVETSSIDAVSNVVYDTDFGFELGGPIVKDRLWFYAGLAPHIRRDDVDRITKTRTDCRAIQDDGTLSNCDSAFADGEPDFDPATGFLLYKEIDRRTIPVRDTSYPFVAKLNFAPADAHQGQVSLIGNPISSRAVDVAGVASATDQDVSQLTTDLAVKWTSKLNDNATELEVVAGWHRTALDLTPRVAGANLMPRQNLFYGDLGTWAALGGESDDTLRACTDGGPDDPFPDIVNCPDEGRGYAIGGPGGLVDETQQRYSARLSGTQRVSAVGNHELKAGVDVEDNRLRSLRAQSGDVSYDVYVGAETDVFRYVDLDSGDLGDQCLDSDNGVVHPCTYVGGVDVNGSTLNWAAYLRDSWQPVPNVTLNVGVRYEEQRIRYAESIQNTTNSLTGETFGKNAIVLDNNWAPRLGVVYDWTKEGRSKLFAHYGRFYESVPMSVNRINLGGETSLFEVYESSQCGEPTMGIGGPDGPGCERSGETPVWAGVGGSGILVAPGTKAQYMDEVVLGAEYALPSDTKLGVSYHNRWLGRVLEDISPDNTVTYVLANPGTFDEEEEARLEAELAATTDPDERDELEYLLEVYRGIRKFDTPTRNHHSVQFTASQRFSERMYAQASYTWSRTTGNFPGIFSPDSGFVAPNITGQYDLIELVANRDGPAPQDRPHAFALDGYYTHPVAKKISLTGGARFRAHSGTPIDVLASNPVYGQDESFLLPRGAAGRTEPVVRVDVHMGYRQALGNDMSLEAFADVFNLINRQPTAVADETYTIDSINPIVGGDGEDALWAKTLGPDGEETKESPFVNRNFTHPEARHSPLTVRLGMRLLF